MLNTSCQLVHEFSETTTQCEFVRNNSECQESQGWINYIDFVYCSFELTVIPAFISCTWLLVLFIIVGRTADDFFCPALDVIAKCFKLSHNVAGVTFLAFGNGAPDIFSSLAGITQMRPELAIGSLFGAGIFVTTVVAGSIILVAPFDMMQRPFLRDVMFYMVSVFLAFYVFYTGKITVLHSIGFILLYIIYLIVVLLGHYIYQKWLKPKSYVFNKPSAVVITVARPDGSVVYDEEDGGPPDSYFWRRRSMERQHSISMSRSLSISSINSNNSGTGTALSLSPKVSIVSGQIPFPVPHILDLPKMVPNLTEETPLLSGCSAISLIPDHFTESKRFLRTVSPIDFDLWPNMQTWQKFLRIIAFPLVLILKMTIPVVDHDKYSNNWCRSLIILNVLFGPIFFCSALGYGGFYIAGCFPILGLLLIISVILSAIILVTSCNDQPPVYHTLFGFFGFGSSVIWIYFLSSEIVSVLKMLGLVMQLSDTILGLTILAWGNSLPDLVADVGLAKQNLPRMGMSGCFGGPLFNLLMGIGIPFTILNVNSESRAVFVEYITSTTILTTFLLLSLISSLTIIPLMGFYTKRSYGFYLISLYLLFFILSVLHEVKLF